MDPKDKTLLITGSTDGVGRVVAQRLGASGAHVLVHGRDETRGKAVVADMVIRSLAKSAFAITRSQCMAGARDGEGPWEKDGGDPSAHG